MKAPNPEEDSKPQSFQIRQDICGTWDTSFKKQENVYFVLKKKEEEEEELFRNNNW